MSENVKDVDISIDDFLSLNEATTTEGKFKQYPDGDYLAQLSSKVARNAAFIAEQLGVTTYTVVRRLAKLEDAILTRWQGNDPFYVLKPPKKVAKGVQI